MLRWPMEADTPRKALKRGPKFKERTASDVCRLCLINLKQKFGDFSKNSYITAVNVFKPWTRGGRQNAPLAPLAELCKHIKQIIIIVDWYVHVTGHNYFNLVGFSISFVF